MEIVEAPFGGGGSLTGAGVGFISTLPGAGEGGEGSSADGAGDGDSFGEFEGGEVSFLFAKTTTTNFSFFLHLSLLPLMK